MVNGLELLHWLNTSKDPLTYPDNVSKDEDSFANLLHIIEGKAYKYQTNGYPIHIEDKYIAMGSGQDYALAALHCGKTVEEAVLLTSKLCSDCGMGVDVLKC